MRTVRSFSLVFLSLLWLEAGAQNAIAEFKKVRAAYLAAENFSADVTVMGYETKKTVTPRLLGNGMLRKNNEGYYSKYNTDEMISNKKGTLIIDHYERKMDWFEGDGKPMKQEKIKEFIPLDSIHILSDSVIYRGESGGIKHLSIYNKKGIIIQTDYWVDAKTYFVNKLVYYYKDADAEESADMYRVEVIYKSINTGKIVSAIFSEKRYITSTSGKAVATDAYRAYKLTTVLKNKI